MELRRENSRFFRNGCFGAERNLLRRMVRVTGFEPAASWSQTTRATSCATPGYHYFLVFLRCSLAAFPARYALQPTTVGTHIP